MSVTHVNADCLVFYYKMSNFVAAMLYCSDHIFSDGTSRILTGGGYNLLSFNGLYFREMAFRCGGMPVFGFCHSGMFLRWTSAFGSGLSLKRTSLRSSLPTKRGAAPNPAAPGSYFTGLSCLPSANARWRPSNQARVARVFTASIFMLAA